MLRGKGEVRGRQPHKLVPGIVARLGQRLLLCLFVEAEAVQAKCCEELGLSLDVAIDCSLRDPDRIDEFPHREIGAAALANELARSVEQAVSYVAVMIAARGGGSGHALALSDEDNFVAEVEASQCIGDQGRQFVSLAGCT